VDRSTDGEFNGRGGVQGGEVDGATLGVPSPEGVLQPVRMSAGVIAAAVASLFI
jgi:hypothetical protein